MRVHVLLAAALCGLPLLGAWQAGVRPITAAATAARSRCPLALQSGAPGGGGVRSHFLPTLLCASPALLSCCLSKPPS